MQVLIEKDSATKIPRECSLEEAHALVNQGFVVYAMGEDGSEQSLPELAQPAPEPEPEPDPEAEPKAGGKKAKG